MSDSLVIVESPAKAKTLNRYLGPGYKVMASYGHVRDLQPKSGAVDPDNGFSMRYEVIEKNAKSVDAIAKAMRTADVLYLATDPDREGEAISWHLHEILKERGVLDGKPVKRVVFHEVTKSAILEAMAHPRELSTELINAQQARRALDYLVGFNLSPLLWKKIKRGLSAGRVQSPALRMIAEREEEIERFKRREYWTIEADVAHAQTPFMGRLTQLAGEKMTQFSIEDGKAAGAARKSLVDAANGKLVVAGVEKKQRRRQPSPPFITSTLQQEAVRKLGFTAQKAMRVAQQLYEGIDVGEGAVGLITYMRTDSVTLAKDALHEIREFITSEYGKELLPAHARQYKTTSKNAQEAHEAIRPTSAFRKPRQLKDKLSPEQFRLYELIWKRTVASQMNHAVIDTVAVDLECGKGNVFRASGSTVAEPGFMTVYQESADENGKEDNENEVKLPPLAQGDVLKLSDLRAEQHFTEPPPRYTEASLVKALEERGIGRPSTYASIISTLRQREYVDFDKKRFSPTEVGRIVNRFLTAHFKDYVDYDFTARLEDELDAVSRGEKEWVPLLEAFWRPFSETLKEKELNVSRSEVTQARILGVDPKSGLQVSVRMGRYGPFTQIGTKDDPDKPRFAGLRPGQRIDTLTLQEALDLFLLPRALGQTADGQEIVVNVGRFGPYVRFGGKFASLKKDDDPYKVSLERALELISEKKLSDLAKRIKHFPGTEIEIINGRFGAYITDAKHKARIPKDREPADINQAEAEALLLASAEAAAPKRKAASRKSASKPRKAAAKSKSPPLV
ncbi:MAG: DNA topoisomerase I [Gammaproteobacteria bacterium RIFCSPLOWO2_02_FULL_61_13]|nr:MAG: DNA topoisomerase I [Gammaproteobacteria bacterium RIFCSPLOWO2_02_FULL_61_13]